MLPIRFLIALLAITAFASPALASAQTDDATIELHWRECAIRPSEGISWFDHCHEGPLRTSAPEGQEIVFTNANGDPLTAELDANSDAVLNVPAGEYRFQAPPGHDAEAMMLACSLLDSHGTPVPATGRSIDPVSLSAGDHAVCDFFVVWDGGAAAPQPFAETDPQAELTIRWRACTEPAANDDWYNQCFAPDSPLATAPQESRRITISDFEPASPQVPFQGQLDAEGNVTLTVAPGEFTVPVMTGEFVTADYLFCSLSDDQGKATESNIPTDPLTIEDGQHIICDYYYVAE